MKISDITRLGISDAIQIEGIDWSGKMQETVFLARLYDLSKLPSTDPRFKDAERDIWQHRFNNDDWDNNWVFLDSRFKLKTGDDELFLRFLCETLHPLVRPDIYEVEHIQSLYNSHLIHDGFEIIEKTRLSGKPIFIGKSVATLSTPAIDTIKKATSIVDAAYIAQQITTMEVAVSEDPALAIGTAKDLIETCCKTILDNRNIPYANIKNLVMLVKITSKELSLTPDDIPEKAKAAATIKKLLSDLATITVGIAELRNSYGTGHGKSATFKGLSSRHAKLAVGAASTLAVFLWETDEHRDIRTKNHPL